MALQHLRSSTADKRPTPAAMAEGQLALNTNLASPGLFFKDSNGDLVKVGPVHVGTTAPNATPASGGQSGNSKGEQWLDTSSSRYVFKIWDGSAWRSEDGEFVNASGDTMTGALGIIAGSAASPSIFISGDTNTGIYSPGADQLAISTSGTGALFIDANQQVYIKQSSQLSSHSSPSLELTGDVVINSSAFGTGNKSSLFFYHRRVNDTATRPGSSINSETEDTYASGSPGTFDSALLFNTVLNNVSGERLRITSDGKLGLGSSSPNANSQLHIVGSSYQPLYVNTTGAGGGGAVFLQSGTQALYIGTAGSSWLSGSAATDGLIRAEANLILATNGNTRAATIDSSGRLLVGTSSSTGNIREGQLFSVTAQNSGYGGMSLGCYNSNTVAPIFDFNTSASSSSGNYAAVANNRPLGYIVFRGSDGSQFVDSATIKAEVDGTPGANDMPGRLVFSTTADGASSPTTRLTIRSNGTSVFSSVPDTTVSRSAGGAPGILANSSSGSTAAGIEFTTDSTATRYCAAFSIASSIVGTITTAGSSTAYNTSSDYRLKENVVPLTGAADRLNQLQVHRFNFIADPGKTVDGFIAHEAQAVVPEAVTGTKDEVDADGNPVYQGIDQSKLVPLLTAALQEALAEIESLKARVTALEP